MTVLALSKTSTARPGFGSLSDPSESQAGGGQTKTGACTQVWLENPLARDTPIPELHTDLVCWSGWFGEASAEGSVCPDVRTWTAPGWEGFERVAAELDASAEQAGVLVILRPHARHVLADPQSTLAWLKRTSPKNLKILLDPAAWLTASMLDAAEDHLARAFESFSGHPAVWGTMLTGLSMGTSVSGAEPENQELIACPILCGSLALETVLGALGPYGLADKPIVLLEDGFEQQKKVLSEMLGS